MPDEKRGHTVMRWRRNNRMKHDVNFVLFSKKQKTDVEKIIDVSSFYWKTTPTTCMVLYLSFALV